MEQRIIYIGLDVHKDTIAVALAEAGKRGAAGVWQDREHTGGVEDSGGEAGRSWLVAFDFAMGSRPLRLRHSAPAERSRARMRRSRPVVDSAQARRSGQNRPRRDAINLANCTERVNCRRCGFQTQPMRRSAIWCARDMAAVRVLRRTRQQILRLSAAAMAVIITGPGLDPDAPALARRIVVRTRSALHRAGGLHRGRRGGERLGGIILKPTSSRCFRTGR